MEGREGGRVREGGLGREGTRGELVGRSNEMA